MQQALEMKVGLCVVAEPSHIPKTTGWIYSDNKLAAIYHNCDNLGHTCKLVRRGTNFVAVRLGNVHILSCYISPNVPIREYEVFLDDLTECIRTLPGKILVCGDFNAWSHLWGSVITNRRGELVEDWAAENELRLANIGSTPTCVRAQGSSVVDLTWASPALERSLCDWKVLSTMEALSDHCYVSFSIRDDSGRARRGDTAPTRWALNKMDPLMFRTALEWSNSVGPSEEERTSATSMRAWLNRVMKEACDASAPRVGRRKQKRQAYWWNFTIAEKRGACHRARRAWTRSKGRDSSEVVNENRALYRQTKKELCSEIAKAKSTAWRELIATIDADPWGLPYKIVLNRLRRQSPTLTETLDEELVDRLLGSLFPSGGAQDLAPLAEWQEMRCEEGQLVQPGETLRYMKKRTIANKAPGLDGFKATLWKRAPDCMLDNVTVCFNLCLNEGVFPTEWKRAGLVLIPKEATPDEELPKVRPICLLDEVGKTLERVIACRMEEHMEANPRFGLSENQFGFRKQRSTCDALNKVKGITLGAVCVGEVALAVSLDIANAFNSLPWRHIREALRNREFPEYTRRMIDAYLSDRSVTYRGKDGEIKVRKMQAGVPQGSVLGPLLWNVTYDDVLRSPTEEGSHVVCYADDTLIIATGENFQQAGDRINAQVARVLRAIRGLGLIVSERKTEVIAFHGRRKPEDIPEVKVGGSSIQPRDRMKYLGIILDSRWNFRPHFDYVETKASKVIRALGRLMPNLRGPSESKRRLYLNSVLSVILYGAPVWSDEFSAAPRKIRMQLMRLQRSMAIRVIAAYRTVSLDAAILLARMPPLHIIAAKQKRIYVGIRELLNQGTWTGEGAKEIHDKEQMAMMSQWERYIADPKLWGKRTREAIHPNLSEWSTRKHGRMTYRITQLLTGHGSFGSYLYRIGKRESPACWFCEEENDNAEHTIAVCGEWTEERDALKEKIGSDLGLSTLVASILESNEAWEAFAIFAESVMRRKEEKERMKEREDEEEGDAVPPRPPDYDSDS
ncbi:reverse transcriptase [Lasius niger]|uniref:Reverse transcriptase n=1 Tax=Lasius niger TaxID=67767 RepID=A0A0J7KIY5_LASNI|nr:reverse transcriptase [Lasius niger]